MEGRIFVDQPHAPSRRVAILEEFLATGSASRSSVAFRFAAIAVRPLTQSFLQAADSQFVAGLEKWEGTENDGYFLCIEPSIRPRRAGAKLLYLGVSLSGQITDLYYENSDGIVELLKTPGREEFVRQLAEALFNDFDASAKGNVVSMSEREIIGYFEKPMRR